MGTTAEKITYLNDTKGLLKNNINLTGAGLTNQTPFREYATDLKTALLNILNNGIDSLYNNFPKTTGTGTNITLNNTLQAPIRSVINGDTEQDGEPTPDNPKEIKSVTGLQKVKIHGKNYIDMSKVTARTDVSINSISNEVINFRITNPNPSLLITNKIPKGTYKVRKSSAIKGLVRFNNANNTQVSSIGGVNDNEQTLIFNEDIERIIIYLTASLYDTTINLELLFSDLVVVNQNSDTSYEPYQTPQEYEINLGKNLFDINNVTTTNTTNWTINANNNILSITHNNSYSTGSPKIDFEILPSGTYVLSGILGSSLNLNINGSYSKSLNNGDTFTCNGEETVTLAFPVAHFPSGTTLTYQNVMLEKGSQATSYSPYFTPIELNKIDTYQDYISGTPDNWVINRKIGSVVLDGTETWNYQYTNGYNTDIDNLKQTTGNNEQPYVICDYYTKGSANTVYQNDYGISQRPNYGAIIIKNKDMANATALKTWLSTHNTKVVYELATPTTEPITNTELIEDLNNFYNKAKSYNGQTNISVEGDLQMILDVSAIIDE